MPKKPPAPQCPMLKEYLRSLAPTGPAARELPEYYFLATIAASIGVGMTTHRLVFGLVCFFVLMTFLLTVNAIKVKPKSADERVHLDSYKAAKELKSKLLDYQQMKHVEPGVLSALEAAARVTLSARQQLATLPPSLRDEQENALAFVDASMRLAILASKPCVRRDDQPRKEFEALCEDATFVGLIVGKIQAREREIAEIEREAGQYQQTNSLGAHLRDALQERRKAEAELESFMPTSQVVNLGE